MNAGAVTTPDAGASTIKTLYLSGYTDDAILHHGVLEEGVAFLQNRFPLGALATQGPRSDRGPPLRDLPLVARARGHGDRPAIIAREGTFSYRELLDASARVAAFCSPGVRTSRRPGSPFSPLRAFTT